MRRPHDELALTGGYSFVVGWCRIGSAQAATLANIELQIDRSDSKPIYEQIAGQVRRLIGDSSLLDGDSLPTVRKLATQLGVSRLTAFKAYAELQKDGLVESRVGRGTVVRLRAPGWTSQHDGPFLDESSLMGHEEQWEQMDVLSLATALPDPSLFPHDVFLECLHSLRSSGPWTFSSAPAEGEQALREQWARTMHHLASHWTASDMLVTSGLVTGQLLAISCLAGAGKGVAVQDPTWIGAHKQIERTGARPYPVAHTESGLDTDQLKELASQRKISLLLLTPDHSWGNGLSLPVENRTDILSIADHYGIHVLESVGHSRIHFAGKQLACMAELSNGSELVLSDFDLCSCLSAGIGMGVLAAKGAALESLRSAIQMAPAPARPMQLAMAKFLAADELESHFGRAVPTYRSRKEAMVRALKSSLPAGLKWTEPTGGYVLMLDLPAGVDATAVQKDALPAGLSIVPGSACSMLPRFDSAVRLSYAMLPAEKIIRAVVSFGRLLKERQIARN